MTKGAKDLKEWKVFEKATFPAPTPEMKHWKYLSASFIFRLIATFLKAMF